MPGSQKAAHLMQVSKTTKAKQPLERLERKALLLVSLHIPRKEMNMRDTVNMHTGLHFAAHLQSISIDEPVEVNFKAMQVPWRPHAAVLNR